MDRATRNRVLAWVIVLGLANFAIYTFFYWYFQGDARNGFIRDGEYFLRGHFLHLREGIATAPVTRTVWIYSFVHSISIWPTIGAVLISMFVLARPHMIATIKTDALISGRLFVNGCMTAVAIGTIYSTVDFVLSLIQALQAVSSGQNFGL